MAARCPTCGEEALTETARFCIGCGGAIPEQEPHVVVSEMLAAEPAPPVEPGPELHLPEWTEPVPPPPPAPQAPLLTPQPKPQPVRDDTPRFDPQPSPPRTAEPSVPPPSRKRPPRLAPMPTMRDTSPIVPLPLVLAGVIGLLALLLILLLAA